MTDLHSEHTHGSDFDPAADDLFIEPPKWPKVVGILSIVFGGLSVTCGAFGVIMSQFSSSMVGGMLNGDPPPPNMDLNAQTIALAVGSLGLNVLLIIAGIMIVNRNTIGRTMHLAYALVFIPIVVLASLNTISMQAATEAWAQDYPNNDIAKGIQQQIDMGINSGLIGAIINLVVGMIWPSFCIIWFGFFKKKLSDMTGEPDSNSFTN